VAGARGDDREVVDQLDQDVEARALVVTVPEPEPELDVAESGQRAHLLRTEEVPGSDAHPLVAPRPLQDPAVDGLDARPRVAGIEEEKDGRGEERVHRPDEEQGLVLARERPGRDGEGDVHAGDDDAGDEGERAESSLGHGVPPLVDDLGRTMLRRSRALVHWTLVEFAGNPRPPAPWSTGGE